MRISKHDLVKLILGLTPRERQEFKELHPNNFDYVELFNHICKNKGLDEKVFAEKLQKQKGNDAKKNINISVIKSYLLEKILNSLRSSYRNPSALVYQNFTYSDILISKGLYGVAENYLEETKVICENNNLLQEELIYFRQIDQMLFLNNTLCSEEATRARFARHEQLLDILTVGNTNAHFVLLAKEFIFYNAAPPPDVFFDLAMKMNSIDVSKNYPFIVQQQLRLSKTGFEVFQQIDNNAMERITTVHKDGMNNWADKEALMEYNGYWFLTQAFGYFIILSVIYSTSEQVTGFIALLDFFEKKTKSSTEKNKTIELRYSCEMLLLLKSSDKSRYKNILNYKAKFKQLTENGFVAMTQLHVWQTYTYIRAHLQLKQYSEVVDCCNYLLYDKDFSVKNFMIFYAPVHFALLQAHYELGNIKFLKYEIAKSRANLEKTVAFNEFEDEFFKLMKLITGTPLDSDKMIAALIVHKANFEAVLAEGFFKANFGLYDVVGWIEELKGRVVLS